MSTSGPDGSTHDLRVAARGELALRFPARWLEQYRVLPLAVGDDDAVHVAAAGTPDDTVADELARVLRRPIRFVDVPAAEIEAAVLGAARAASSGAGSVDAGAAGDELATDDLRSLANQGPVITLVNVMLVDAVRMRASDVHLEQGRDGLRVRVRLDGVLHDVQRLAPGYSAAVVSRVKLMAGLNIAERRRAQDGRALLRVGDREIDVRVSTLPALHGENVVMRVLDHSFAGPGARSLGELGMPDAVRESLEALLQRNSGLVLVTGPTGSGKTTTLYAALAKLNRPGVKIVSVEDPVEYQLAGVTQTPVNVKAGFGFADALRSILRHDPDVLMVGEMRDAETSTIAIQAALTGHLVFSTLHTTDAAGGVTRLVDMGIAPYLVAATVQGILAQRLVRTLCDRCAEPYAPSAAERSLMPDKVTNGTAERFRRPRGCESCAQTGFRGRTGIYQLLVLSEALRALVVARAPLAELRNMAGRDGMRSLADDGWAKVRSGMTSVDELLRVTSADEGVDA